MLTTGAIHVIPKLYWFSLFCIFVLVTATGWFAAGNNLESYPKRERVQLGCKGDSAFDTNTAVLTTTVALAITTTVFLVPSATPQLLVGNNDVAHFPKRIWQSWNVALPDVTGIQKDWVRSWINSNPTYRHEFFSDANAEQTLKDVYGPTGLNDPHRLSFYLSLGDAILRADIFRYLMLYAYGGLWTDFDTSCQKPISEWIPSGIDQTQIDFVLGIEYEDIGTSAVHLVQWTLLAKPRRNLWLKIADKSQEGLEALALQKGVAMHELKLDFAEVLDHTGPKLFTTMIFKELSRYLGKEVTSSAPELQGLVEPVVLGNVLFLPIQALNPALVDPNDSGVYARHWFLSSWFKDRSGIPWDYNENGEGWSQLMKPGNT